MLDFAAATAVCNYNVGYASSYLPQELGTESSTGVETYLNAQDINMDIPYKRKMRDRQFKVDRYYAAGKF